MAPAFRLSLAHASLLHVPPPDLIRVAAAAGFEAVSLRLIPVDRAPHWTPAEHDETRRALAETGVRVQDVEVLQIREDQDPRTHLPTFEAAAELGARFILANIYMPNAATADEKFAALCDLTEPLGLGVALEFVSFSNLRTLSDAVDVVRRSGRDNACVLIDTLHFAASRAPVSDLAKVPPDLVQYVHLCDAPGELPTSLDELRHITREARLMPGEGGIDIASVLRRLPRDVVYAVEAQNPARGKAMGAEAYARLAYEATTRYLSRRK